MVSVSCAFTLAPRIILRVLYFIFAVPCTEISIFIIILFRYTHGMNIAVFIGILVLVIMFFRCLNRRKYTDRPLCTYILAVACSKVKIIIGIISDRAALMYIVLYQTSSLTAECPHTTPEASRPLPIR